MESFFFRTRTQVELDKSPKPSNAIIRIIFYTKVCIGYRTFQTKELSFIGSGRLLFPHEYTGEGRDGEGIELYLCTSAEKEAFHILLMLSSFV
jgi:hypothetical protein